MAHSKRAKRAGTAGQRSAAQKANAAEHRDHPAGHQTPKQLYAERANLVAARQAQLSTLRTHKAQSAAQLAAERKNLAKARLVEVRVHGKGHQTPKQLAAERRNAAKARAAYYAKYGHAYGSKKGRRRGHRVDSYREVLGSRKITASMTHKLTPPRLTGVVHKFYKDISPVGFDRRTSWRLAKGHHAKRVLKVRTPRAAHVKTWHKRKNRLVPR